jgi:hypothetical protein
MLASIRPKARSRYLALPILGAIIDEFTTWSRRRGYALGTIRNQLKDSRLIDAYLQADGAQAAIHSFFRYVAGVRPECLEQCQRLLTIPFKRKGTRPVEYLEFEEIKVKIYTEN